MVYAKEAKAAGSNPRALAEALARGLREGDDVEAVEVAGPGFLNIRLKASCVRDRAAQRAHGGRVLRSRGASRRRRGQRRIRQRQSHGPDACRPRPRRRVRRRARQSAGVLRRARWRANITSTTPGRRWTCSPARRSCATARRWARRSGRYPRGSIPAITSSKSARRWRPNTALTSRKPTKRIGCRSCALAPSTR